MDDNDPTGMLSNAIVPAGSGDAEQSDAPVADPWERLEGEPGKWFDRFEIYRHLGPGRSVYEASQQYLVRTGAERRATGGVPGNWLRMSRRWNWIARAEAWDAEQRLSQEKQWLQRQSELREQEWQIAKELLAKAQQMLVFPLATTSRKESEDGKTVITTVVPTRWQIRDSAIIADVASKLARLAAEMETSRSVDITANVEGVNIIRVRDVVGTKQVSGPATDLGKPGGETPPAATPGPEPSEEGDS